MRTKTPPLPAAARPVATEEEEEEELTNDDDAALLDDLLAFLEEPLAAPDDATAADARSDCGRASTPPASAHQQQRPRAAKKRVDHVKRSLETLRAAERELTCELLRLRRESASTRSAAVEAALTERFKRRRVDQECERLRDAVYAQSQFIDGLASVFSAPPSLASGLNLNRYLHKYTKLPRDQATRCKEYAVLAHASRLQRAMEILCRETETLTCGDSEAASVLAPGIKTDQTIEASGFAITTTSVYAVDTREIGAVLRGACVAVFESNGKCQSYRSTFRTRQIVDPEAASLHGSNLLYRTMGMYHESVRDDVDDRVSAEARTVTLYKETDDFAVVLWDFVDEDELHPIDDGTDVTRQAIGACLIRRELCDDGIERAVFRAIHSRRYVFHENRGQEDARRRFQQATAATMRGSEMLFRATLLASIETEEAAYVSAMRTLAVAEG